MKNNENKDGSKNSIPVLGLQEHVGNYGELGCGARICISDLNNYPKLFECSKCENGPECCFTLESICEVKTAVELEFDKELSATQLEKQVDNNIETSEVNRYMQKRI